MKGDSGNIRLVIIFLGLVVLIGIIGGIYLAAEDRSLPGELIAIVGAAGGSLASILAKTSTAPQAVEVVNRDADPVPVEPQPVKAVKKAAKKRG